MKYEHIRDAITEMAWAIMPSKLEVILDVVAMRSEGDRLTHEEIQARIGGKPATREPETQGAIALIPIYGVLIPRADAFSEMSGASSAQKLMGAIRAAAENPQIGSIILDIDSPGGSTHMTPELAAEIRKARDAKPVIAVANTLAASAAYWLGSQADEFVASPSAMLGSIGVFGVHIDRSEANEKEGIKFTYVHAGAHKVELNPNQPLSDEARAAVQERIDAHYEMFVGDVASGRRVSREKVLSDFGQGRIVTAQAALKRGMVDRIDTLEGTIARLLEGDAAKPGSSFAGANASGDLHVTISDGIVKSPQELAQVFQRHMARNDDTKAAKSGLSFADQAETAHAAVRDLIDRTRSLAEFRDRRRLRATKREQLADVLHDLAEACAAIDELLAETNPTRATDATLDALVAAQASLARSI